LRTSRMSPCFVSELGESEKREESREKSLTLPAREHAREGFLLRSLAMPVRGTKGTLLRLSLREMLWLALLIALALVILEHPG